MTPDHLTPAETAKHLGLKSAGTLANWRAQGRGPRYVKHGRRVLYPVAAVEAYKLKEFKPCDTHRCDQCATKNPTNGKSGGPSRI